MKWFVKCLRNYANFKGRAARPEFWYFILFAVIIVAAMRFLDTLFFGRPGPSYLTEISALLLFLPQVAVMTRRLHDTGRSGKLVLWYYVCAAICSLLLFLFADLGGGMIQGLDFWGRFLANFLFVTSLAAGVTILVWFIYLLVWFCKPGDTTSNSYGPPPVG